MAPPGVPGKKKKTVDNKKALSKGFGGIKVKGKSITKNEVIKKKSKLYLFFKISSETSQENTPESQNCPLPSNEPPSSSNPFGLDYASDSDSD